MLITGGTGTFGKSAAIRLLEAGASRIKILSRDEFKQESMRQAFMDPRLDFYLGDVRDRASIDAVMRGVDLVFHAAALKQVPSCEFFPMQAVMTNVVGSFNVLESAIAHGVERAICLGTDKAAYPINAMGMTKALMEKIAQSSARLSDHGATTVASVRYGNVIASRGSVVPLFARQIAENAPVTITEPDMTRFLLPLPRAIDLVLFALEHAQPGDLFIRKAPACTVRDISSALHAIAGREVSERVIGMRHGEKMFETLATMEELSRAEDMGEYYRVVMDDRNLNYEKYFTEGDRTQSTLADYTSHNTEQLSVDTVREILAPLPEVQDIFARVGGGRA